MIPSIIFYRLDLSDGFWEQFSLQNKAIKKQVRLYEIESIDNANIINISVNVSQQKEKYKAEIQHKIHEKYSIF